MEFPQYISLHENISTHETIDQGKQTKEQSPLTDEHYS